MKTIIKDKKGNEYVYIHFIGNYTHYLIPYIDVAGRSKKYCEHHFIPRDTWISINKGTNFDDYSITKEEFIDIVEEGKDSYKKILEKYHNSF